MNDAELVVVATFLNKIDAELAQGALKAANHPGKRLTLALKGTEGAYSPSATCRTHPLL
jgi:hypothetical protein